MKMPITSTSRTTSTSTRNALSEQIGRIREHQRAIVHTDGRGLTRMRRIFADGIFEKAGSSLVHRFINTETYSAPAGRDTLPYL